jgi:hypothetical protein
MGSTMSSPSRWVRRLLYRWLLPRLIAKRCEDLIHRSGAKAEAVNCYVVAIDRAKTPYFLATAIDGDVLTGLRWNGRSYADDASISMSDAESGTLRVTHYYGLATIPYESVYGLAWNYVTRLVYLRIRVRRYIESTYQYVFNKKKVVTKNRMDLLQLMMDDQLDRTHDGIASLDLMIKLYSMRMLLHPSFDLQHKKLVLYLDSLVSSGELKEVNDQYIVTGKALATIERLEEEERRHGEAVKVQRGLLCLTFILAIAGIVQAGVVKLPTLIDVGRGLAERTSTLASGGIPTVPKTVP